MPFEGLTILVMVGVAWAAFLTYYELRKQKLGTRPMGELTMKAQEAHLEGEMQGGEVIRPGVYQHLTEFKGCFLEIDAELRSYYRCHKMSDFLLDEIKEHLPDKVFWEQVDQFKSKADETDQVLCELDKEIQGKAEKEVAPLRTSLPHITPTFTKKVIRWDLAPWFEADKEPQYYWQESGAQACDGKVIAAGVKAEAKHREFIKNYKDDERIKKVASLMSELRSLRSRILNRIEGCLYKREYIHYQCPHCPSGGQSQRKSN